MGTDYSYLASPSHNNISLNQKMHATQSLENSTNYYAILSNSSSSATPKNTASQAQKSSKSQAVSNTKVKVKTIKRRAITSKRALVVSGHKGSTIEHASCRLTQQQATSKGKWD